MTLTPHTRLIVMGTPGFILPTLYRLINEKAPNGEPQFDLVAVYTRAPKPTGRGLEVLYSPVHQAALELQKTYPLPFKIMTPETFKDKQSIEDFKAFKPDLVVVGAYGLILPQELLDIPSMGFLNLHASLLPYGRGASPIQRAILDGKEETGLTIMKVDAGCDTGLILKQKSVPITPTTTANDLCIQMAEMGPDLLMETLHENPKGQKQDENKATYAKKISKQEAQINWNKSPAEISRQIRAFSTVPGAFTFIKDDKEHLLRLKIYNALVNDQPVDNKKTPTGAVLQADRKVVVACQKGALELTSLQLQGKKSMTGVEFTNGRFLKVGDKFVTEDLSAKTNTYEKPSPKLKKKIAHSKLRSSSSAVWYIVLFEEFKHKFGFSSKTRQNNANVGRD